MLPNRVSMVRPLGTRKIISMKKFHFSILLLLIIAACQRVGQEPASEDILKSEIGAPPALTMDQAKRLVQLPLQCIQREYPNKLGQTLTGDADLKSPQQLHPAFYGCFDWHSAVHGHWSLVYLLSEFPGLPQADSIVFFLEQNLTAENIQAEIDFFDQEQHKTFERMYGWAWLLKLAGQINDWDHPAAAELSANLEPLAKRIAERYLDFLPNLIYPVRVGTHTNTAFGLSFAYDYALSAGDDSLRLAIETAGRRFFMNDRNCPLGWEPSGYDFLSPCLEEAAFMSKILSDDEFSDWIESFLPGLSNQDFDLGPGLVSDRSDGLLVHLDGVNFSRAWCLYQLADTYPEFHHLRIIGDKHVNHSLGHITDDHYEGGHWLASFELYALKCR